MKKKNLSRGFTLIEILLVFSVVSILSVATALSFSSYNAKLQLNNSSQDLLVMLHTAKAKAQSQISPSTCVQLKSYQVMRCAAGPSCLTSGAPATTYELQAVCSNGTFLIEDKSLQANVTFDNASLTTVSFAVLTGGATTGAFIINSSSGTRTLTVSSYGQVIPSGN